MTTRHVAVISGGLSQPSSTRMLADRLAAASAERLKQKGVDAEVAVFELRDIARDITNNLLTGFPSPKLAEVIDRVTGADGLIAVTPIFTTSYSGLFKSFFDVLDNTSLTDMPVLIGATGGTPRHSLALEYSLRPMFTYLHSIVVPTSVFAATADWGSGPEELKTLSDRILRGAEQFAALTAVAERTSRVADPFVVGDTFSPVGAYGGE
ncbi:MAG: FMN reductase [Terrimesophilobacter sp.]